MGYKLPKRIENSNKSTYGRVLNIAGSDYMSGAAYLSSVSALKVGCGYCFLCSSERVIDAVAAQTQNIVFLPYTQLLETMKTADVVEIGCGLSQSPLAVEIFERVIDNISPDTKLLIDADGLNILAKNPSTFFERNLKSVILTPHPKEAARLLWGSLGFVLSDITACARKISQKYHATVALKTHKSVVTSLSGEIYENSTGNNCMAKAGSGDVLAGMISGLWAQGLSDFEATVTGVYLHGLCGDFAKEKLTEYSVMADDLISFIPSAIRYSTVVSD